jgi:hypothetical protein
MSGKLITFQKAGEPLEEFSEGNKEEENYARLIEGNRRLINVGSHVVDLGIQGVSLEIC